MSGRQNDLDNLMRELGVDAPRSSDITPADDPSRSSTGLSDIGGFDEEKTHSSGVPTMFRRNEPDPTPPDMSGKGLDEAIDAVHRLLHVANKWAGVRL